MRSRVWSSGLLLLMLGGAQLWAQSARPDLSGMWSDPPSTAVDQFCFMTCTDAGIAYLNKLLDDPANDSRPFTELAAEATRYQREDYIRPRLTPAAAKSFPMDPADDPGFLQCEPWGLARQIFAPHQMAMRQYDDRIEIRYGEWDGRRTVYLGGRRPTPPSLTPMGYSVGRYEGNTLVVETTGIAANLAGIFPAWFTHGDRLTVIERYTRTGPDRLELMATLEDPQSLRQTIQFKKAWGWAPTEKIFPYTDCVRPSEFRRRENQQ